MKITGNLQGKASYPELTIKILSTMIQFRYFSKLKGLLVIYCVPVSAQTLVIDFETSNPFSGGLGTGMGASGSGSLLVGGQNSPQAFANFSSQLNYVQNQQSSQFYGVMMDIGIEATGIGNAIGFQVTESGSLNNGTGPNFQFVEGHNGGQFVFSTGQQGSIFNTDLNGNSWNYGSSAPQVGELFSINFLAEFYYPGFGDANSRTFDYNFSVIRSDPNDLVAVDELTFFGSKTFNPGSFTNSLGQLTFRGSGVGGFQGSMDNLIVSTSQIVPIPEPTSALLAASGVGLLFIRRRVRK